MNTPTRSMVPRPSRRRFIADASALGAASLVGSSGTTATDLPLETTKVRLVHAPGLCLAPQYIAEEFLRLEGFTEVEYARDWSTYPAKAIEEQRADFTQDAAWTFLPSVEAGRSVIALAGIHAGCYELFGSERVRRVQDLKGKTVAIPAVGSPDHMLLASMLAYVGIDPVQEVDWKTGPTGADAITLYLRGKADAYLAFAPQGYELRARKAGRAIVNIGVDRPWSQYFCCMVVGSREFTSRYPNATKRALRAFLKAADICASNPQQAARMLVDRGFESRYDVALQVLRELSYDRWRQSNPEDTLRFYALRLREAGMLKSSPTRIIAQGTDWRFLHQLQREMKG